MRHIQRYLQRGDQEYERALHCSVPSSPVLSTRFRALPHARSIPRRILVPKLIIETSDRHARNLLKVLED